VVGHDETEHCVTQEFEALVRVVSRILGTPRSVRERRGERRLVSDRTSESLVQRGEPGDGKELDGQPPSRPTT
jgi:hypothetical protein